MESSYSIKRISPVCSRRKAYSAVLFLSPLAELEADLWVQIHARSLNSCQSQSHLPGISWRFLLCLARQWLDILPPAAFRCEKNPVSGHALPNAGTSIRSVSCNATHCRLISFLDAFSRRMHTLSSASTDSQECRIPLGGG